MIEVQNSEIRKSYFWEIVKKESVEFIGVSGMTREGLSRKILPIRGEWKDDFHYVILEDDLPNY